MAERTLLTRSPEETEALGEEIGRFFNEGGLIVLSGPLGAGKTTFVRGFARGVGIDPARVSSPTFTIAQEYGGFIHLDLYRLLKSSYSELVEAGIEELLEEGRPVVVEWMHKELMEHFTPDLSITFDWSEGEEERKITLCGIMPE